MGTLFTGDGPPPRYNPSTGGPSTGGPSTGGPSTGGRSSDDNTVWLSGRRPPARDRQAAVSGSVFDMVAGAYDDAYPHKSGQIIATQWLIDRLQPESRVLDLGCGTGVPTADMLSDAGHHVLGLDVSAGMLERARRAVPAGTFIQRDMREVDGSLGVFDAAAVFHSLSMLPRADILGVLRRVQAVLRPGAPVAVGMVEGNLDHRPQPLLGQHVRLTALPQADLVAVVSGAGLTVLEVDVEDYEPAADLLPERHLYLYCLAP